MARAGNKSGRLIVFIRFFWRKSSKSKPQVTRVTQSTQTDGESTVSDPQISVSVQSESGLGSPASDTNIFQVTRETQTDSDSALFDPSSSVSAIKPEAASPPSDDIFFDEIGQLIRRYKSVELTGEAALLLRHIDRFKNGPVDESGSPPRTPAEKSIRSDIGVMTPPPSPEKEHGLSSLESSYTLPDREISTPVEEYLTEPIAHRSCTVPKFMHAFRYTDYEWRTARKYADHAIKEYGLTTSPGDQEVEDIERAMSYWISLMDNHDIESEWSYRKYTEGPKTRAWVVALLEWSARRPLKGKN